MAHVYASVAQFNDFLRDEGAAAFVSEAAVMVARKLAILEASSRTVDEFCNRSRFGSGFGPRTGTNRYDGVGRGPLRFWDDLLSLTSLTCDGSVLVADTDYHLVPYDTPPYRSAVRAESPGRDFGSQVRGTSAPGKWGYQDVRRTATATASAIGSTTTTSVIVSADAEFSAGQTLKIDAEDLYVTAVDAATDTLTVKRGQNGTTAATHGAAAAIDIYEYPAAVVDVALRIALRRWKARDAGADATEGGGDLPLVAPQSERSILRNGVGHLRLPSLG